MRPVYQSYYPLPAKRVKSPPLDPSRVSRSPGPRPPSGEPMPGGLNPPLRSIDPQLSPRNQKIHRMWKRGYTLEHLAMKFALTVASIQEIVHDERRRAASRYYDVVHLRTGKGQWVKIKDPLDRPLVERLPRRPQLKAILRECRIRRLKAIQQRQLASRAPS